MPTPTMPALMMISTLTRSYSCRGLLLKEAEDSLLLHESYSGHHDHHHYHRDDLPSSRAHNSGPRIIIHQGRKIVRKKKRQCVKCKENFDPSFPRLSLLLIRGE